MQYLFTCDKGFVFHLAVVTSDKQPELRLPSFVPVRRLAQSFTLKCSRPPPPSAVFPVSNQTSNSSYHFLAHTVSTQFETWYFLHSM